MTSTEQTVQDNEKVSENIVDKTNNNAINISQSYSTELLKMLYTPKSLYRPCILSNDQYVFTAIDKTSDIGEQYIIFVYIENQKGFRYDNIVREQVVRDILIMQSDKEIILFNLSKQEEIARYTYIDPGFELIFSESILIFDDRKIINFLIGKKQAQVVETKTSNKSDNFDFRHTGRDLIVYSINNKAVVLDIYSGNLIGVFYTTSNDKEIYIKVHRDKFCDICISEYEHNFKDGEPIYFICGKKVFNKEDYLKYIGVKSVEKVTGKDNVLTFLEVTRYYNVETYYNNKKGIMSSDMTNLKLDGSTNILNSNFENYRKKHLKTE